MYYLYDIPFCVFVLHLFEYAYSVYSQQLFISLSDGDNKRPILSMVNVPVIQTAKREINQILIKLLPFAKVVTSYWFIDEERKYFFSFLAHLSRRLIGELIVYKGILRPSVRLSTFSNDISSETVRPILFIFHI